MILCLKLPHDVCIDPFDTDTCVWMLLKHICRVGRAASHQCHIDIENYENGPLNKSFTAIMNKHT